MKTATMTVNGMTCGGCVTSVKRALAALPGVAGVDVSLPDRRVQVRYDDGRVDLDAMQHALQDAGYEVAQTGTPAVRKGGCCCS